MQSSELAKQLSDGVFEQHAFAKHPEVLTPNFWEQVFSLAQDPEYAEQLRSELQDLALTGACDLPWPAQRLARAVRTCNRTLRKTEIERAHRIARKGR
jgi:hypothetical protein